MRVLLFSLITFFTASVHSAILIQSKDAQQQVSSIYIEGQNIRINMPENEGYVLVNGNRNTMHVVVHQERSIMDMSELLRDSHDDSPVSMKVKATTRKLANGPRIAGYSTVEYGLYANNQYCGSLYISDKAMQDLQLHSLAQSFLRLQENIESHMSQFSGIDTNMFNDPCEDAELAADRQLMLQGFPLKSIDKNRKLTSVVTKINKNARLPARAFSLPEGYAMTSPDQMMKDAMQDMQPEMQQEMQRAMQQMTPEMRQMLQQQMQQFQQ